MNIMGILLSIGWIIGCFAEMKQPPPNGPYLWPRYSENEGLWWLLGVGVLLLVGSVLGWGGGDSGDFGYRGIGSY